MSPPALAAFGLSKRFGRSFALRDVDLEVAAGDSVALLGPNGAGKSTFLRLACGLARPTTGRIEVGGQPADGRAARGQVGLVGDRNFLYAQLTARENLVFAARLHGVADPGARADALLADVGLAAVADRRVAGFSRGMAQRLAIARGRVHDPALLLLDEPFDGLDRASAGRLCDQLAALAAEGRTLLLVTHDFARAAALARTALVLVDGRVAASLAADDAGRLERAYAEAAAA